MRVLAVTNMYPTENDPTLGTFVEQQIKGLRQIHVDIDIMYVNRAEKGILVYSGLGSRLRREIQLWRPDIVHIMYGGVMADVATYEIADRPTLVSFCGDDLLGELLSGTVRKFISRYGVQASFRAAKRASGIIVKSRNLYEALPRDVPRSKVRIIPNGVDLDRFKPLNREQCQKSLGWARDDFHVLFPFNNGDPRKRPNLAESAVDLTKSRGIPTQFHRLTGVRHCEVPTWLNASDVVLLTSLHEGSPNIIKEALACNVPIVSVDVGDVRERLDGLSGCYLTDATTNDLADKLSLVYECPKRVDGRVKMQEMSINRVALQVKDFYMEVLSFWGWHVPAVHA